MYFMLPLTLSQWIMIEMRWAPKRCIHLWTSLVLPPLSETEICHKNCHYLNYVEIVGGVEGTLQFIFDAKKNSWVKMSKTALFVDRCWASTYFLLKFCFHSKWHLFLCETRALFNFKRNRNLIFNWWTELISILSSIWMNFKREQWSPISMLTYKFQR